MAGAQAPAEAAPAEAQAAAPAVAEAQAPVAAVAAVPEAQVPARAWFAALDAAAKPARSVLKKSRQSTTSRSTASAATCLTARGSTIKGEYRTKPTEDWRVAGECELPVKGDAKISLQTYQGPADAEHWAKISQFRLIESK